MEDQTYLFNHPLAYCITYKHPALQHVVSLCPQASHPVQEEQVYGTQAILQGRSKSNSVPRSCPMTPPCGYIHSFFCLKSGQIFTTLQVSLSRTFSLQELILKLSFKLKPLPPQLRTVHPELGGGALSLVFTHALVTHCCAGPFRVGYRHEEVITDETSNHHLRKGGRE